jgi:hypothetical protein
VPALLPWLSAASLLTLAALPWLRSARGAEDAGALAPSGVASGVRSVRQFPYLLQLAALVALGALADVLLDYLIKAGAARALGGGAELARFFSLFYASVALATLAVQAGAARAALERLGLSGTVAVQPAAVALVSLSGLALPSLAGAALARGLGGALRDSLFRSGYELFFTPLPPWQKRRSKALVDVAADKLGALAGASVVLLLAAQRSFSERWLWLLALASALASLQLARRLHRGYVGALEHSLRAGLVDLGADEVLDSTTRLTLTRTALDRGALLAEIRALQGATPHEAAPDDAFVQLAQELRCGQPERIRGALARVGDVDPALAHLLVGLLERDDVLPQVVAALRRAAPRITGQLVDALLDPQRPTRVRRRVPRVLEACPGPRAVEGLVLGLADADFSVRRACGVVLALLREKHAELAMPAPALYQAVARELGAAAADPEAQLDHVFALLSVVGEREPLRVSRWAFRRQEPRLRGTALEYLEQVLPEGVRRPLLRRLGEATPAPARPRPLDEVEDELRRSAVSLPRVTEPRRGT